MQEPALEQPALDLTRVHRSHVKGDITVYLTWWLADDSGPQPCLVLIPTHRQSWEKTRPAVVLLNHAWQWSEEVGDPVYAARASMIFANGLGLNPNNPTDVIRVRSIIVDHLGELVLMPPMPDDMRPKVVLGEARVRALEHDQVVRHHEIVERV